MSVLLDEDLVLKFRNWLGTAKPGSVAILTCDAGGSGISTLIVNSIADLHIEAVYVAQPTRALKSFLVDSSSSSRTVTGARKILVVDPVDSVISDPTSSADFAEFMKSGKSRVPIVLAGIRQRSSLAKIRDVVKPKIYDILDIQFPQIEDSTATTELVRLFPQHARDIDGIWARSNGDFSTATKNLAAGFSGEKDHIIDGTRAISKLLFESVNLFDAQRIIEGDSTVIASGIFENYALTGQDIDVAAHIADTFSGTDLIDETMFANQRFELVDIYNTISAGAGAVLAAPSRPFQIVKYGSLWSKNSNIQTKKKSMRAINSYLASKGRVQLDVEGLAYWKMIGCTDDTPDDTRSKLSRMWKNKTKK